MHHSGIINAEQPQGEQSTQKVAAIPPVCHSPAGFPLESKSSRARHAMTATAGKPPVSEFSAGRVESFRCMLIIFLRASRIEGNLKYDFHCFQQKFEWQENDGCPRWKTFNRNQLNDLAPRNYVQPFTRHTRWSSSDRQIEFPLEPRYGSLEIDLFRTLPIQSTRARLRYVSPLHFFFPFSRPPL